MARYSNTLEISHVTPTLALYYSFYAPSTNPFQTTLGPADALDELRRRGCLLATKLWVDNHWSLILWKLAGMVYFDPRAELDPKRTRWCWSEVIRQLLYR
jgi:breast cancer 2 susceptibility protein